MGEVYSLQSCQRVCLIQTIRQTIWQTYRQTIWHKKPSEKLTNELTYIPSHQQINLVFIIVVWRCVSRFRKKVKEILKQSSLKLPPLWVTLYLVVSIYIYFACLPVCCLYPVNVKTAEPTGSKFCVGPRMTPEKVNRFSVLPKVVFDFFKFKKCAKK